MNNKLLVKISSGKQDFWVRVIWIEKGIVHGKCNSYLLEGKLQYGDSIEFPVSEIKDIADWNEDINSDPDSQTRRVSESDDELSISSDNIDLLELVKNQYNKKNY